MSFKILFIIGVIASGITEYLKKLLPTSFVEKKATMPIISGLISAISALVYGLAVSFTWPQIGIAVAVVVALSQSYYSILFKTFEALRKKWGEKVSGEVNADKLADEISDTVLKKVESLKK